MSNDHVRVALVTGANRGIGFETAHQLLAKGLVVVLAGRDTDALERARGTLGADDRRRAVPVQLDVTNLETISAARRAIGEAVPRRRARRRRAPTQSCGSRRFRTTAQREGFFATGAPSNGEVASEVGAAA